MPLNKETKSDASSNISRSLRDKGRRFYAAALNLQNIGLLIDPTRMSVFEWREDIVTRGWSHNKQINQTSMKEIQG